MKDFLRKVPLFEGLSDQDLDQLLSSAEVRKLAPGEMLFNEGDAGDSAFLICAGDLEIIKSSSDREVLLAVRKRGEVIGEVALFEDAPRMAGARARGLVELLVITKEDLNQLVETSGQAARIMFHTILGRFRSTGAMLRQSEKMAQLGTLTAGVAHELNNPAAAVKRGADQLAQRMGPLSDLFLELSAAGLDEGARDVLSGLRDRVTAAAKRPPDIDPLDRSDREAEFEDWFDDHGVDEGWEHAPLFVGFGLTTDDLEPLVDAIPAEFLSDAVGWVGGMGQVESLLAEIFHGSGRLSDIVKALKTYSYLDQAPVQDVDVHEGLEGSLLILRNKLKKGIAIRRDFDEGLPHIRAYGSELNQVWTNLIDNACDALDGEGEIRLATHRDGDSWIVVEIQDNGPGIPEEIQGRIFDSFFTTKPPGKGTGLGLDISYRIVVDKHRGEMTVYSEPGFTCFRVMLPVDFEKSDAGTLATPATRMSDEQMRNILEAAKTIAVVGATDEGSRPSHSVPAFLVERGYEVTPVNPRIEAMDGIPALDSLGELTAPPDIVVIFRRPDAVPGIVDEAIALGAKTIWMQEGIVHEKAAEKARHHGLKVVMDTCVRATTLRLLD